MFVWYSDWLRAGRSGDRIPVETRFSAAVQTGPWPLPVSYTCIPRLVFYGLILGRNFYLNIRWHLRHDTLRIKRIIFIRICSSVSALNAAYGWIHSRSVIRVFAWRSEPVVTERCGFLVEQMWRIMNVDWWFMTDLQQAFGMTRNENGEVIMMILIMI